MIGPFVCWVYEYFSRNKGPLNAFPLASSFCAVCGSWNHNKFASIQIQKAEPLKVGEQMGLSWNAPYTSSSATAWCNVLDSLYWFILCCFIVLFIFILTFAFSLSPAFPPFLSSPPFLLLSAFVFFSMQNEAWAVPVGPYGARQEVGGLMGTPAPLARAAAFWFLACNFLALGRGMGLGHSLLRALCD